MSHQFGAGHRRSVNGFPSWNRRGLSLDIFSLSKMRNRVPLPLGALLSKLRNAVRSRSRIDAGFMGFSIWKPVSGMSRSLGRGWREAPGEGRKCTLIRPFGPPSPRGRRTRASIWANLDTTAPRGRGTCPTGQPCTQMSKLLYRNCVAVRFA